MAWYGCEGCWTKVRFALLWPQSTGILSWWPLLFLLSVRLWLSDRTSLPSLNCPLLKNGQSQSSPLIVLLWELNEMIYVKSIAQSKWPKHGSCYTLVFSNTEKAEGICRCENTVGLLMRQRECAVFEKSKAALSSRNMMPEPSTTSSQTGPPQNS